MYAIIRTGGKQAKVRQGDVIQVELLKGAGDEVSFTPLLVVTEDGTAISGHSDLASASVTAKVLGETKGEKIDIFKYKNKTGYRKRQGHRQRYTSLEVTGIAVGSKKALPKTKAADQAESKAAPEAKTAKPAVKKPTSDKPAVKKPAAKKSAPDKPAAKKPAADAGSEEE